MNNVSKPKVYREVIDELVHVCHEGQGQIGPERARAGIWNANATPTLLEDQYAINLLLKRLSNSERETLASLLAYQVVTGVFETLKVLEEYGITPFKEGYEGSPYHDFIGRLADWEWPKDDV